MNIKLLLSTTFIAASFSVSAQDANKTFAITGDGNHDFMWMNIRQVDITTGKIVNDVYQREKTAFVMKDADSTALSKKDSASQSLRIMPTMMAGSTIHRMGQ